MKIENGPVIISNTDDPQAVVDETRAEMAGVMKQQRSGFLGFINRIFGGGKMLDDIEADMQAELDDVQQTLKDNEG